MAAANANGAERAAKGSRSEVSQPGCRGPRRSKLDVEADVDLNLSRQRGLTHNIDKGQR